MMKKYPATRLMSIRIDNLGDRTFAEANAIRDASGNKRARNIILNRKFALDPEHLATRITENEQDGELVPGSGDRPVYSTIVHEFAHAIDFTTEGKAREEALSVLLDHHMADKSLKGGFTRWMRQELSGYSFDEHGMLDRPEALAEAFTDVELNGANASDGSKLLHKLLVDTLADHAASTRPRTDPSAPGAPSAFVTQRKAPARRSPVIPPMPTSPRRPWPGGRTPARDSP